MTTQLATESRIRSVTYKYERRTLNIQPQSSVSSAPKHIAVFSSNAPYYITEACRGTERQDQRIKEVSTVQHVIQSVALAEAANVI